MAILNNNPLVGASGNQGGYNINNSLRFRSSASAYLSRTPASAGNRKTFTWSAWVKRGALGSDYGIFSAGTNSSNAIDAFEFNSSNQIRLYSYNSAYLFQYVTTAVYRDPSAWYHIVVAVDTTQATAGNRVKLYVNGQQVTAFSTQTDPTQNSDCNFFNTANLHAIGATYNNSRFLDGYQTDINFIDGSAKTPSDFGETDTTTGVWKPKAYSGTYGTNGFYLKFSDIATTSGSNAGLGKDFSGNSNYWTTNNISVTSGTTYDAMTDSPTNTSATVANYAVMNPLNSVTQATLADGNLNVSSTTAAWKTGISTIQLPTSGKWYFETTIGSGGVGNGVEIGLVSYDQATYRTYKSTGTKNSNTGGGVAYGASYTSSDIIGAAIDVDAGTIVFYKNNSSQGTAFSDIASAVPSSGWYLAIQANNSSNHAVNFGQRPFSYTPPTGYVRLNTFNLPTPTILQGNSYFDAVTYNGSNSNLTVTNAGSFQPDLVWAKSRSGAYNNILVDAIRGGNLYLSSNTTAADTTSTGLATFTSSGITWIGGASGVNASGDTYVDWMWKAGNGTSSNTAGSITSTVSVNTTSGFSVVTANSGSAGNKTVGHGLGVAPKLVIMKVRDAIGAWYVWVTGFSSSQFLILNATDAVGTDSRLWANATPTSSVVSFESGYYPAINKNLVFYCWAEISGFSKFGSYTGNGSADGTFVYLGFRPKWIIIRPTNAISSWTIEDTARSTYNVMDARLFAEGSDAEVSNGNGLVDYLSNGFKPRVNHVGINGSGNTYIYAAFAENPFKNSLAR